MFKELGIKQIDFDITMKCNFACDYCYQSNWPKDKEIIDALPDVTNAMMQRVIAEQLKVSFFGGEPLMAFDQLANFVLKTKMPKWSLTSNLSLLDDSKAKFVKTRKGKVHASIDGNRCAHDCHRKDKAQKGTYDLILPNIKRALEISPGDTARMSVMPDTAKYVYDSVISLFDLGFKSVAPMPVMEASWDNCTWSDYEDNIRKLSEYILSNQGLRIKNFDDGSRVMDPRRPYHCGAGFNNMAVSAKGFIWPCHRFTSGDPESDFCFGNILTGIKTEKVFEYRKQFVILNKQCRNCYLNTHCSFGCPNVNYNTSGSLTIPNQNHCIYMQISNYYATSIDTKRNK